MLVADTWISVNRTLLWKCTGATVGRENFKANCPWICCCRWGGVRKTAGGFVFILDPGRDGKIHCSDEDYDQWHRSLIQNVESWHVQCMCVLHSHISTQCHYCYHVIKGEVDYIYSPFWVHESIFMLASVNWQIPRGPGSHTYVSASGNVASHAKCMRQPGPQCALNFPIVDCSLDPWSYSDHSTTMWSLCKMNKLFIVAWLESICT